MVRGGQTWALISIQASSIRRGVTVRCKVFGLGGFAGHMEVVLPITVQYVNKYSTSKMLWICTEMTHTNRQAAEILHYKFTGVPRSEVDGGRSISLEHGIRFPNVVPNIHSVVGYSSSGIGRNPPKMSDYEELIYTKIVELWTKLTLCVPTQ